MRWEVVIHPILSSHAVLDSAFWWIFPRPNTENKVSKFCMDAGFLLVVEIGQYFMTKDTEEQFCARASREYTLPRNDESSQPKGWIQGNTKIGPVLEITTS